MKRFSLAFPSTRDDLLKGGFSFPTTVVLDSLMSHEPGTMGRLGLLFFYRS
jgi:hypothetical protein